MKHDIQPQDMAGKTIAHVFQEDNDLIVVFDDGHYTFVRASPGYYGEVNLDFMQIELRNFDPLDRLAELGVISAEELAAELNSRQEFAARRQQDAEKHLRQQYEFLKQKFGDA